jgi:hypothetical protein
VPKSHIDLNFQDQIWIKTSLLPRFDHHRVHSVVWSMLRGTLLRTKRFRIRLDYLVVGVASLALDFLLLWSTTKSNTSAVVEGHRP